MRLDDFLGMRSADCFQRCGRQQGRRRRTSAEGVRSTATAAERRKKRRRWLPTGDCDDDNGNDHWIQSGERRVGCFGVETNKCRADRRMESVGNRVHSIPVRPERSPPPPPAEAVAVVVVVVVVVAVVHTVTVATVMILRRDALTTAAMKGRDNNVYYGVCEPYAPRRRSSSVVPGTSTAVGRGRTVRPPNTLAAVQD